MELMGNRIHLLSEQTVNQIAAGEVIENPASVVKELVENGVDARSTHICIEILSGGFQWIKVSDNGSGMSPDEAVLCLQRHATSKIVDADDLFSLTTMGFRGEALASIAAISKMTLLTALENAPAVCLEVEGGKIKEVGPDARSRGTSIEVRSLFYNVPARKKFQKSAAASSAEITKVVTQLALAHPDVGFDFIQQNQVYFSLPPSSQDRAAVLLGEEYVHALHLLEMNDEKYSARGWVGDPLHSRRNRSGQYLFINGRPVFCPSVSYAIRDAYGTRLDTDRHPIYLLHLTIPPEFLDVNVHPQKREVRLREEGFIKHLLHKAVGDALCPQRAFSVPVLGEISTVFAAPDFSAPLLLKEEREEMPPQEFSFELQIEPIGLYRHYLLVNAQSLPSRFSFEAPGIVWFDLPAVESRLQFEAVLKNSERPLSQGLLIPLTFSYSRAEAQLLRQHLEIFQNFGVQIREIGQSVFLVDAIPPFLEEAEVATALEEMIGELKTIDLRRRWALCVCRRVRARKKNYHLREATHLVKELSQAEDPWHCPQGKKTFFYVREEEIENNFHRKAALSQPIEAVADGFEKAKA
jgi:DNA mismatch repair protein MutL